MDLDGLKALLELVRYAKKTEDSQYIDLELRFGNPDREECKFCGKDISHIHRNHCAECMNRRRHGPNK